MILEFEGYRVEEAATGLEAVQKVRERPPDAILLDIRMPEMDGLEALRTMRERGYEVPVIVLSGHADVATAVDATRRGAFDFFEKPLQKDRCCSPCATPWRPAGCSRTSGSSSRSRPKARRSSVRLRRSTSCANRSNVPRRRPPPC
ncbi:MAG: response regulator [Thermoanaerobaculia bacterium]